MSNPIFLDGCRDSSEVKTFFRGIRHGILEMENFHNRKNVNTGEPLKIEELLKDYRIFEELALSLKEPRDV